MEQYNKYAKNADMLARRDAASDVYKKGVDVPAEENSLAGLEEGLRRFFGEEFDIRDGYSQEMLLQHLYVNREQNRRLSEALERDPRLAQMLMDMIEGKRNAHSAVARYFGRQFVEMDEHSPEYREMLIADEERMEEAARMADDRREYEANLQESLPAIEAFCEERGYEMRAFLDDVWEKLVFPILSGKYSKEVCLALDHALTYDKDVEDAFAAGDIKGRNTNIQRMKEELGDGLPKGMGSAAPGEEPRRRVNRLIERALNA